MIQDANMEKSKAANLGSNLFFKKIDPSRAVSLLVHDPGVERSLGRAGTGRRAYKWIKAQTKAAFSASVDAENRTSTAPLQKGPRSQVEFYKLHTYKHM